MQAGEISSASLAVVSGCPVVQSVHVLEASLTTAECAVARLAIKGIEHLRRISHSEYLAIWAASCKRKDSSDLPHEMKKMHAWTEGAFIHEQNSSFCMCS